MSRIVFKTDFDSDLQNFIDPVSKNNIQQILLTITLFRFRFLLEDLRICCFVLQIRVQRSTRLYQLRFRLRLTALILTRVCQNLSKSCTDKNKFLFRLTLEKSGILRSTFANIFRRKKKLTCSIMMHN